MTGALIDGIVAALRAAFPEVARIYTEEVRQGLKEPCFILRLINPTSKQFLGNRYHRANLFSVQYFPEDGGDARAECYAVNDRLFRALEYITVEGALLRGTRMNGESVDGTLLFFVNFDLFVIAPQEIDPMEELWIENQAK